jgi:iron-sulfur cluster assembly protein
MSNIVSIASKPAEGASVPQQETAASQAPAHGLHVTDAAVRRVRAVMAKEGISPQEGGLRLGVSGGGCSGLSYVIKFDSHSRERDRIFDFDGIRIFIDPKSFVYLQGLTLDYEETLIRQGFTFNNPNATRSCGCGTSFTV